MLAQLRLPGCGLTTMLLHPGSVARMPKRPHTTALAGALAHGWLQLRFGFSSTVHASIVAVAPARSIEHHEFVAHDVSISRASWPLSGAS